jgi:predicted anti-sigma-YlaC factor YlaD
MFRIGRILTVSVNGSLGPGFVSAGLASLLTCFVSVAGAGFCATDNVNAAKQSKAIKLMRFA